MHQHSYTKSDIEDIIHVYLPRNIQKKSQIKKQYYTTSKKPSIICKGFKGCFLLVPILIKDAWPFHKKVTS